MVFNFIKSKLIYFTRARRLTTARLKIFRENYLKLTPKELAYFLGV